MFREIPSGSALPPSPSSPSISALQFVDPDIASTFGASIFILLGLSELVGYAAGYMAARKAEAAKSNPAPEKPETSPLLPSDEKSSTPAPPTPDPEPSPVGLMEAAPIALGLCLTNVASGAAAGMAGYNPWLFSALTLFASLSLLALGQSLAVLFQHFVPHDLLQLLSGVLLVSVGISNIPYLGLPSETDL